MWPSREHKRRDRSGSDLKLKLTVNICSLNSNGLVYLTSATDGPDRGEVVCAQSLKITQGASAELSSRASEWRLEGKNMRDDAGDGVDHCK
jgi:hypothetical protein